MKKSDYFPEQYERPSGSRYRKPTFVVATEGEKTEPDYFAYLDRMCHGINIILLPATSGHSQPRQVLDRILSQKKEYDKGEPNSYLYWIVFDHDHRPRHELESVMQDAEDNQISVADSNPCFEAWLVQHFSSLTDIVELSHSRQVKRCNYVIDKHLKLPSLDPNYKKRRLDSKVYMPKVKLALQNAEFDEITASDLDVFTYTGSRVHKLVKDILPDD